MSTYFVFKSVAIEDGILNVEDIKKVKAEIALKFSVESGDNNPTILIVSETEAHLTFRCNKRNGKIKVGVPSVLDRL